MRGGDTEARTLKASRKRRSAFGSDISDTRSRHGRQSRIGRGFFGPIKLPLINLGVGYRTCLVDILKQYIVSWSHQFPTNKIYEFISDIFPSVGLLSQFCHETGPGFNLCGIQVVTLIALARTSERKQKKFESKLSPIAKIVRNKTAVVS